MSLLLEAFEGLRVSGELAAAYADVAVERIQIKKEDVVVYAASKGLVHYKNRKKMEDAIKRQLFADLSNQVTLHVKYEAATQYSLEELLPLYYDNLLGEVRENGVVDYEMFRSAKKTVEGNVLRMECDDCRIYRRREMGLKERLERSFRKQCGMEVEVCVTYREAKKRKGEPLPREDFAANSKDPVEVEKFVTPPPKPASKPTPKAERPAPTYRRNKKDPDVIFGRECEGTVLKIADVQDEMGEVVVRGKVLGYDERELKNGKTLLIVKITDYTDSIRFKLFLSEAECEAVKEYCAKDAAILVKAKAAIDDYDKEVTLKSVIGIKPIEDFGAKRMDRAEVKRVELHAHTFMSEMDGFADPKKLVTRAKEWGHKAIAITDHGVVQAFPAVNGAIKPQDEFKAIYGVEAYLVDDLAKMVLNGKGQSLQGDFVVFDIETTGFDAVGDKIIEMGAVKIGGGRIVGEYQTFVNPGVPIPDRIRQLTKITDAMVAEAPSIGQALPEFLAFCGDASLVAHNAAFDTRFIKEKMGEYGREGQGRPLPSDGDFTILDTLTMARVLMPGLSKFRLGSVAKALNVTMDNHHRAIDDARATAEIFVHFLAMLMEKGVHDVDALAGMGGVPVEAVRKLPMYHAILLAQNDAGRVNLYELVSLSHMEYYRGKPRIPKSVLEQKREGLLLGSACEAGELFRAILGHQPEERLRELVEYYDFLEIQPIGNNGFMIKSDNYAAKDEEDLRNLNRRIVELGESCDKPVVATGDVHFIDPMDEAYRRIIMKGKGFDDADEQAPLYLKTTDEMLEEFAYLGRDKAYEVVVTNTNGIADRIERISPVRPDKCPPVIENSDKDLREMCYTRAHAMYGDELPALIEDRLGRELESIIGNGFAVMYIIAWKLVSQSNRDGYLVGSRGSVGSSFAATMAGITEVNPLPAHYYCGGCRYTDFDSEEVRRSHANGGSGFDLPDKLCPVCGEPLRKEGHDIPFETFLGFHGDKEPDIDLNFSGEYQSRAHDYVDEIFGKENTFRAGTVGTMKAKTAYGFVKKYYEEAGEVKRKTEIERLVAGCEGVKRTTGQHPGGIIVLPHGENIYSFTPIQKPANDMATKTITTHFDYHSIEHNLLKLDMLGHDDPTMIRELEDLTGVDAKTIPFDEPKVLSLFLGTDALGIGPDALDGCDRGCLGIPEFGTEFVMQMLRDTSPKAFSDLVQISGLSHGTDVWLGNAQYYIKNGDCTLSTAICTRDDIMTYLIHMGVENGTAFNIMEMVRRGRGLTEEFEEAMREAGVPEWYIESCKKIKYMFPKAHAVAYVMMAFRIAYYKVYHPLAYYAAYYGVRANGFDYSVMCRGREELEERMREYKKRSNELSQKEQDVVRDAKIVQEMYARGFAFAPIDLYKVKAKKFQIIDGQLMPSLSTIEGLGEKAALAVEEEAAKAPFTSRDDFKNRCKVSKTVVESMLEMGIFGDLPESEQMSIMDFLGL